MNTRKLFYLLMVLITGNISAEYIHLIKKGETIYNISRRYNISAEKLLEINKIEDPTNLKIGTPLLIPSVYVVEKGDTFYSIAKKHNTTVSHLMEINNLDRDYLLKAGDHLILPQEHNETQSEVQSVALKKEETDKQTPFWPHHGTRTIKSGKLSGAEIQGEKGDSVVSVTTGQVVWAGPYRGFGKVVLVKSAEGYIYLYGGNDTILVRVGDFVNPGMEIGKLGINPHEDKPILFFSVFKDGKPVDPEKAPRG